ncbi:hypothetical protein EZV62_003497 [Acer yangbiense]|uniref:F-box domain-containing protein n=1 Tax=Acer yangbiense TaxID=1000413 RepID=A0A5C7IIS0_9ROSI|nr:hypothetical protein EZV62_003497 [Acer yangbiense]
MDICVVLPEDCISRIISFTSPRDACRSSVLSPAFKSAADSDAVWETFLPSDYQQIISSSSSTTTTLVSLPKKDLYFYLCDSHLLVNNGTLSFSLNKENGKKCYMVGARRLSIVWGHEPQYWTWTDQRLLPESRYVFFFFFFFFNVYSIAFGLKINKRVLLVCKRFAQVAELKYVWWFDVKGRLETKFLSSKTNYVAYLVFKFANHRHGFEDRPIELSFYLEGRECETRRNKKVVLDPQRNSLPQPYQLRGDGWMEIEMGEFFNEHGADGVVVCSLFDFDRFSPKGGLIVEGIQLRPKN